MLELGTRINNRYKKITFWKEAIEELMSWRVERIPKAWVSGKSTSSSEYSQIPVNAGSKYIAGNIRAKKTRIQQRRRYGNPLRRILNTADAVLIEA
jgi:hypothetical protein